MPRASAMTLKEAQALAAAAGTPIQPATALAIFLEAVRLADKPQATLSAAKVLLHEEGNLAVESDGDRSSEEVVAAALAFAREIFGENPPLALGWQDGLGGGFFPTLRHLIDALEFQLLRSRAQGGPPPPTSADCRLAVARLVADLRRPSAAPVVPEVEPDASDRVTDPPPPEEEYALDPGTALEWREKPPPVPVEQVQRLEPDPPAPGAPEQPTQAEEPPEQSAQRTQKEERLPPVRSVRPALIALTSLLIGAVLASSLRGRRQVPAVALPERAEGSRVEAAAICLPPIATSQTGIVSPPPDIAGSTSALPASRLSTGDGPPSPTARPREKPRSSQQLESGEKALENGAIFEALVAFHNALDERPPPPRAARRLGDAYRLQHEDALALAAYQQYLQLAPAAPDAEEVRSLVRSLRATAAAEE